MVEQIQYNVTLCDCTILKKWPGVMNSSKCLSDEECKYNISLRTYTCTSYIQEYIVYNKYENVNIISYPKGTKLISIIINKVSINFIHQLMW